MSKTVQLTFECEYHEARRIVQACEQAWGQSITRIEKMESSFARDHRRQRMSGYDLSRICDEGRVVQEEPGS